MARSKAGVETSLRATRIVATQLDDAAWRDHCWRETTKPVDALESGRAFELHRWQLPWEHPQRGVGGINDRLMLTEDDERVEAAR